MNFITWDRGIQYAPQQNRILISAHIADIHFGAFDPKTQFDILVEQFIFCL